MLHFSEIPLEKECIKMLSSFAVTTFEFLCKDLALNIHFCILYGKDLVEFRLMALFQWHIAQESSIQPLTYFCKSNRNHIKTYPLQGCPLHNTINIV